jgi:hypothetical protein
MIRARTARLKMHEPLADVRIWPAAAAINVLLLRLADEQSEHIAGTTSCVGLANHLWRLFRHESTLGIAGTRSSRKGKRCVQAITVKVLSCLPQRLALSRAACYG